jgi:hypothetical protein
LVDGDGRVGAASALVDAEASARAGDGLVGQGVELVADVVAVGGGAVGVGGGVVDGGRGRQDGIVPEDGPVAVDEVACRELLAVVGGGESLREGVVQAAVSVAVAVAAEPGRGGVVRVQEGDRCALVVERRSFGSTAAASEPAITVIFCSWQLLCCSASRKSCRYFARAA